MKTPIMILMLTAALAAQTTSDKTYTIPDFKVTEQSLAKAMPQKQSPFVYPPALRTSPMASSLAQPVCLTVRSYRFDTTAAPKLVSQTDCTMSSRNVLLRVHR